MDQEVEAGLDTKHVTVEVDTKQKVDTKEADIATKEKVDMGMEVGRQARQLLQKPLHLNRCLIIFLQIHRMTTSSLFDETQSDQILFLGNIKLKHRVGY